MYLRHQSFTVNAKFSKNNFFKPSYAQFVSLKTNNSIFKQILKSYFRLQSLAQQLPIL